MSAAAIVLVKVNLESPTAAPTFVAVYTPAILQMPLTSLRVISAFGGMACSRGAANSMYTRCPSTAGVLSVPGDRGNTVIVLMPPVVLE